MSIEKLNDSSKFYVQTNPYVQILNTVVTHIKDNDAFRIYSFLSSKSCDWKVVKEWTAKECRVGQRKAVQVWAYLERCGLIEYVKTRDELGRITGHDVMVLNGSRFNPYTEFLKEKKPSNTSLDTTGAETAPLDIVDKSDAVHRCNYPPSGESTRVGFAPLLNKDLLQNKDLKRKKEKSFYKDQKKDNQKRHSFADSMDQNANEQKHIEQHEQIKRAPMPDYLREMCKKMKVCSG